MANHSARNSTGPSHSCTNHPEDPNEKYEIMNERIKRFSIGAVIFLLSLAAPFETNFSQEQYQLIKPCMADAGPEKKEDTTNTTRKKRRKRQKTKAEKKDRNDQKQTKGSNCN